MSTEKTEKTKLDNLRKNQRIEYYSKIYCTKFIENGQAKEFDKPMELILLNISAGGLGILSEAEFETGTVLVLNVELEGINYERISARVMWGIKKGNMYRHGLEIINISGRLFSHLRKLDNSVTATV